MTHIPRKDCTQCSKMYEPGPMQFEYHPLVQVSDQAGVPVTLKLQASAPKGFGREGHTQWINYRRNHIQLNLELLLGTYQGSLNIQVPHMHFHQQNEYVYLAKQEKPIAKYRPCGEECSTTHTITSLRLNCRASSSNLEYCDRTTSLCVTQSSTTRSLSDLKPVDPFTLIDFRQSQYVRVVRKLERLQFSRATQGNDVSRISSQEVKPVQSLGETFNLELEVYAETLEGLLILIGYAKSQPCISRGRAPCHFETLCPLHKSEKVPRAARASKKVTKPKRKRLSCLSRPLTPPVELSPKLEALSPLKASWEDSQDHPKLYEYPSPLSIPCFTPIDSLTGSCSDGALNMHSPFEEFHTFLLNDFITPVSPVDLFEPMEYNLLSTAFQ